MSEWIPIVNATECNWCYKKLEPGEGVVAVKETYCSSNFIRLCRDHADIGSLWYGDDRWAHQPGTNNYHPQSSIPH